MQLVADVGHLGAVHDLPVGGRDGVDIDDGDEVRAIDAGALVQGRDVHELLGRLLARHLRGRVPRAAAVFVS